jgi:cytochrome c5
MVMKKNLSIFAIFLAIVVACAAAIEPAKKTSQFKNLQILPKTISEEALQKIMEIDFNKALGVSCDYCHAKIAGSSDLDYPSDAKGEKEVARSMMRMTIDINKKHFAQPSPMIGDTLLTVTCMTCHNGEPYPVNGKK